MESIPDIGASCFLWKPDATLASTGTLAPSTHLAEFVLVTTAQPVSDPSHLDGILKCPPPLDMMAKMLSKCPLTGDHFRIGIAIPGTFAVWVLTREGHHSLIISHGYGGAEGILAIPSRSPAVPDDTDPCLDLVAGLATRILGRSIPAETVLSCCIRTTHGDFTVYAIGVPLRCDVCSHEIGEGAGFSLSAKHIVGSPHYWRMRYELHKTHWAEAGICTFDQYCTDQSIKDSEVRLVLGLGSAWLVCDACIINFAADREVARGFAVAWWKNKAVEIPADWAATASDVNMG